MAMICQEGGCSRRFDDTSIRRAIGQDGAITEHLFEHMLATEILFEDSGIVGLGPAGERLFGAKNFMALMSVFDTPSLFQVICGQEELGWVHPLSFCGFGQKSVVLSLGGRSWEVLRLDEDRSIAHVRSADAPGRSRWLGGSRALSYQFCQTIRDLLVDDGVDSVWSRRAVAEIAAARSETSSVCSAGTVVETDSKQDRTRWWTFGGLKANASLAAMLKTEDGTVPRFDNYFVELTGALGLLEIERWLKALNPNQSASGHPAIDPPGRVKFWECIPEDLRALFIKSRFTDTEGALKIIAEPRTYTAPPDLVESGSTVLP